MCARQGAGILVYWGRINESTVYTFGGICVRRRVRGGGVAVFPEWRYAPLAWSFDPSWDTVRAVSAGPDDADGRVRVEIGPDGTLCVFR